MKFGFILIASLMISSLHAGDAHYDCTIKNVYEINDEGALVKKSKKIEDIYKGTFSISRLTGDVVGVTMPTTNASQKIVINPGNSEWSFKALSIYEHPNGNEFNGIEVLEYREGLEKPFYAISVAGVISGTCK